MDDRKRLRGSEPLRRGPFEHPPYPAPKLPHDECVRLFKESLIQTGRTIMQVATVQASTTDEPGLRAALTSGPDGLTVVDVIEKYAQRVEWPHSGYDPATPVREWGDRIRAALAATPAASDGSLDVERLARAMHASQRWCDGTENIDWRTSDQAQDALTFHGDDAREVAAEYARLTELEQGG